MVGAKSIQAGVSCIVMDEKDNVATLLCDTDKGTQLTFSIQGHTHTVSVIQHISFRHKMGIGSIKQEDHVIKYGESIGAAIKDIVTGEHVHVHNIEGIRGRVDQKRARSNGIRR
jgi:altronate dehydratase small subunit